MNTLREFVSQIASLPAPAVIIPVGIFAVYWIITRVVRKRVDYESVKTAVLLLDLIVVPAFLIVLQAGVGDLAGGRAPIVRRTLWALLALSAAWLIARILRRFVWIRRFRHRRGSEAPRILQHLVSGLLYLAAIGIIFVVVFEGSISGVLVSTGVIVGVIGLALQNVLGDLFSGITITLEKPYGVGDWISLPDGSVGEVTDISWQATYLKSFNSSRLVVPNSYALKSVVHNYSRPTKLFGLWITVSVDRSFEPSVVRRLLLEAALTCDAVIKNPTPAVNVSDATGNPIRYMVYVHFRDYISHFGGRNDLFMNIYTILSRAGISTAPEKYEIATETAEPRTLEMPSLRDELRNAKIFSVLSEEQIDILTEYATCHTYHPEEEIVSQGNDDNALLIITSGVVQVIKKNEKGREIEIARLGAGDIIGEMSLLTGEKRSATVKAMVQVTLIQVTKEGLEPILKAEPALSDEFAQVILERQLNQEQFLESMKRSNKAASDFVSDYLEAFVRRIRRFFRL